jgi:hypothetical protein
MEDKIDLIIKILSEIEKGKNPWHSEELTKCPSNMIHTIIETLTDNGRIYFLLPDGWCLVKDKSALSNYERGILFMLSENYSPFQSDLNRDLVNRCLRDLHIKGYVRKSYTITSNFDCDYYVLTAYAKKYLAKK